MTRTAPDPVRTAAARAELLRRAHRRPAAMRHVAMQVAIAAAVLVAVAAILIGVRMPRTQPAGTSTLPTPADTTSVTPGPVTSTGTPTPEATEVAPAAPGPTSSAAPTPVTTPPSATGTATPSTLVTPTGAALRSDEEVRAFTASLGFSTVWAEQAILDRDCMAEHGFLFDPVTEHTSGTAGLTADERQAYDEAMYGPATDEPYDWTTAGCHGRSVHLTGQDDAN